MCTIRSGHDFSPLHLVLQDELCEGLGSRVSQAGRHLHPLLDRSAPAWAPPVVGQGLSLLICVYHKFCFRFGRFAPIQKCDDLDEAFLVFRCSPRWEALATIYRLFHKATVVNTIIQIPEDILPTSQFFCARNFSCCCAFPIPRCLIVCQSTINQWHNPKHCTSREENTVADPPFDLYFCLE